MHDKPRGWRYYAAALAASLLPALLAALLVWQVQSADTASAGKSDLNTAKIIASDFENYFEQFDALLKLVGRLYVDGVESGSDENSRLIKLLEKELVDLPFASRIFIADSSGRFVLGGGAAFKYAPTGADVSDRQYFARSKAGESGLIFEGPHKAKFGDEWVIVLSRRLDDSKGGFLGVVAGSIPVEFFQKRLERVELDPTATLFSGTPTARGSPVIPPDPARAARRARP